MKKLSLIGALWVILLPQGWARPPEGYPKVGERIYVRERTKPAGSALSIERTGAAQLYPAASVVYRDPDISVRLIEQMKQMPKTAPKLQEGYKKSTLHGGSIPIWGKYRQPSVPFKKPPIILDGPKITPLP
ncbi:MAG: hypothetical protein OXT67_03125 [Zetaproteobacteria bacterium]|nr:hypothetical protein [Zetaproteobacteria bacterium]